MTSNLSIPQRSNWAHGQLEYLNRCPVCDHEFFSTGITDVKDWFFGSSEDIWSYSHCSLCKSLFLNPRPTADSIAQAYRNYYTHTSASNRSDSPAKNNKFNLSNRIRELRYIDSSFTFQKLLLQVLSGITAPLFPEKFPKNQLFTTKKRGTLIDVGCGDGEILIFAKSIGWEVQGIEIDPTAANTAREKGLNVLTGSYDLLATLHKSFDCIICSHVLEHVHNPKELLANLVKSLARNGTMYVSYPNPDSIIRKLYGKYWRGFEAPRHLTLPQKEILKSIVLDEAFGSIDFRPSAIHTLQETLNAKHGNNSFRHYITSKIINILTSIIPIKTNQDIVEMIYTKH